METCDNCMQLCNIRREFPQIARKPRSPNAFMITNQASTTCIGRPKIASPISIEFKPTLKRVFQLYQWFNLTRWYPRNFRGKSIPCITQLISKKNYFMLQRMSLIREKHSISPFPNLPTMAKRAGQSSLPSPFNEPEWLPTNQSLSCRLRPYAIHLLEEEPSRS